MKNSKYFFFVIIAVLIAVQPLSAVLKEENLSKTLAVLKKELENDVKKQEDFKNRYEARRKEQHDKLVNYMQTCEQVGLMLYSQKTDFTFDVAYACQQATDLYKEFNELNVPYEWMTERISAEIERYDSLITMLESLPPSINDKEILFEITKEIEDSIKRAEARRDSLAEANAKKEETSVDTIHQLMKENSQNVAKNPKEENNKKPSDKQPYKLSLKEQEDRALCVEAAKQLKKYMEELLLKVKEDSYYYEAVAKDVKKLNDYAQSRYDMLQQSIYQNAGSNYFSVLSSFPIQWQLVKRDFNDKYMPLADAKSDWRGSVILMVSVSMLVFIIVAVLLSIFITRVIPWIFYKLFPNAKKKIDATINRNIINQREMRFKRLPMTIAVGIGLFALVLSVMRNFFHSNLLVMAAELMITVAWLLLVVFISQLIRIKGVQIKAGINIYLPFLVMAFIVMLIRIVLLPNSLINLFYPLLLLIVTIWQIRVYRKLKNKVPISDAAYASISMAAMVVACVCAWIGYTLLAVQIIMWWMFQLAAIQTITCIYHLLQLYETKYIVNRIYKEEHPETLKEMLRKNPNITEKEIKKLKAKENVEKAKIVKKMKRGVYFTKTWIYDFLSKAVVPFAAVLSVIFSIKWAADIFEMSTTFGDIFFYNFIDKEGLLQLSLYKISLIVAVFFLFKFVNYALRGYYYHWYKKAKKTTENMNDTLVKNVIAILVWGSYFIFALILLQVPQGGISLVTAGLATGMGFAMKDLLENFFYGISLMTGRLKVGDFIECDGVQGTVESITYQSTQIVTLDGSVMAFLNSALFNKNFKNLTRNNNYVLVKIPVGVAYGTNVEEARQIIVDALKPLADMTYEDTKLVNPKKEIQVFFADFGDSSVNLVVAVWMLVERKLQFTAQIKETIYQALGEHDIVIPFPQTDVHIK